MGSFSSFQRVNRPRFRLTALRVTDNRLPWLSAPLPRDWCSTRRACMAVAGGHFSQRKRLVLYEICAILVVNPFFVEQTLLQYM